MLADGKYTPTIEIKENFDCTCMAQKQLELVLIGTIVRDLCHKMATPPHPLTSSEVEDICLSEMADAV